MYYYQPSLRRSFVLKVILFNNEKYKYMIHEEKCYCVTCDNCGETYMNDHSGFSLFVDENQLYENIDNDSWFTHGEGEHKDKHYCEKCYKCDEADEDKIILDESRKKLNSDQNVQVSDTTEAK